MREKRGWLEQARAPREKGEGALRSLEKKTCWEIACRITRSPAGSFPSLPLSTPADQLMMPRLGEVSRVGGGEYVKRTERQNDFYYVVPQTETDGRGGGRREGTPLEVQVMNEILQRQAALPRVSRGSRLARDPRRFPLSKEASATASRPRMTRTRVSRLGDSPLASF